MWGGEGGREGENEEGWGRRREGGGRGRREGGVVGNLTIPHASCISEHAHRMKTSVYANETALQTSSGCMVLTTDAVQLVHQVRFFFFFLVAIIYVFITIVNNIKLHCLKLWKPSIHAIYETV